MPSNIDDEFHENPHDRIPSEIFTAIAALQNDGTKTELLKRRSDAICLLLDLLLAEREGASIGTLYDHIAIQAQKDGLLPPKKSRGRPKPHSMQAVTSRFRKAMLRREYKELRKTHPKLNSAERLELMANRHETERLELTTKLNGQDPGWSEHDQYLEWLDNVIRASRKSLSVDGSESHDDLDIIDIWRRWEATE